MKFVFIAKHRNIWPVAWLCNAMGVSRSGFHAWLNRSPSARSQSDETVGQQVKVSFLASDRTYGGRLRRRTTRSSVSLLTGSISLFAKPAAGRPPSARPR